MTVVALQPRRTRRRSKQRLAALCVAFALLLAAFSSGAWAMQSDAESEGWLVAALRVEGQFDLYAMPASGGMWQQLTDTPDDERWPAWSPDGTQLFYTARRDLNWDIYVLDVATGDETRLTTDPDFDGYPALSPDGKQLAFSSTRAGDLDLWLQPVNDADEAVNLTPDSVDFDFAPYWEDDETLIYTSTLEGSHDLYRMTLDDDEPTITPLTDTIRVDERTPQLLPNGDMLVQHISYASRDLQRIDEDGTPLGDAFSMTSGVVALAVAPNSAEMAWVERRWEGDVLYRSSLGNMADAVRLFGPAAMLEDLTWGVPDSRQFDALLGDFYTSDREPYESGTHEIALIDNLDAPEPTLSDAVVDSYGRLRERIVDESGLDFLDTVSETVRPLYYATDESDYLSWHKAGRALDTLLYISSPDGGRNIGLLLIRDDWHGDVYWRILLRCPVQDGSCGQPLVVRPWQYAAAESADEPAAGGIEGYYTDGYYVDFTLLAWDEGWERIASYQAEEFDWRETLYAMEYWHYQNTNGLTWYPAMQEIYDQETLDAAFSPAELESRDIPTWILKAKGLPSSGDRYYESIELVVP